MTTTTQDDLRASFINPQSYTKFGTVPARLAYRGEQVKTIIDGEVETTNTAKPGDVVVTGPKGEEYIVSGDKFRDRYQGPPPRLQSQYYTPVGTCWAVPWNGPTVEFRADWGEMMIMHRGDFLCSTTRDGAELYRIERQIFFQTYRAN